MRGKFGLWTRIKIWWGTACPICGGDLESVYGWPRHECVKCHKTFRW